MPDEPDVEAESLPQTWSPTSSAIARVEYNSAEQTCYVTFTKHPAGPYTLENFPEIEFERWREAASPGGYWNAFLRGRY
jgi:hypothetical protein